MRIGLIAMAGLRVCDENLFRPSIISSMKSEPSRPTRLNSETTLSLRTFLAFFCGSERSIERVADTRLAFPLGIVFLLGAGLARNYDRSVIHRDISWLILPPITACTVSMLIFGLLWLLCFDEKERNLPLRSYLPFLRCFLMTTPLAWLYGFPIEKFISDTPSAVFDLILLVAIPVWQGVLLICSLQVIFRLPITTSIGLILAPGAVVALVQALLYDPNLFAWIGGVSLSDAEEIVTLSTIMFASFCFALSPLAFLFLVVRFKHHIAAKVPKVGDPVKISATVWMLGIGAISIFVPLAIPEEPKIKRYANLSRLVENEDYAAAADFMRHSKRRDYPVVYSPMRLFAYHRIGPDVLSAKWPDPFAAQLRVELRDRLGIDSMFPPEQLVSPRSSELLDDFRNHPNGQELLLEIDPRLTFDKLFPPKDQAIESAEESSDGD